MSTFPYTVSGSEYSRTSSGEEITLTYAVSELSGEAAGKMYAAATANGLPRWLARHPTRPDLQAADFRAIPMRDQPNTALVTVRYRSAEFTSSGDQLGDVTVSMSTEVVTEETTKDINGDVMRTSYISRIATGLSGSTVDETLQIHRVAVERPTFAVQFSRVEETLGFSTATLFAGKVNSVPWQGRAAKHWLIRVSAAPLSEGLWRVRYDAVFNPKSWVAEITHVKEGVTPFDVTDRNGVSFYDVYESIDYNRLRLPRTL